MKKFSPFLYVLMASLTLSSPAYAASGNANNGAILIVIFVLLAVSGTLVKLIGLLLKIAGNMFGLLLFVLFLIYVLSQGM